MDGTRFRKDPDPIPPGLDTDELAAEETRRIGAAVRAMREKRGLRQNELADLAGLSPSQVSAVENARRAASLRTLRRLCAALDATVDDLLRAATGREERESRRDGRGGAPGGLLPGMESVFLSPSERLFAPLAERGIVRTTQPDSFAAPLPPEETVKTLERRFDDYLALEKLCGAFGSATIPLSLPFRVDPDGAERLASRVRSLLGLGDSIVLDYVSVLENHGVRIVFLPLPQGLESLSFLDCRGDSAFIAVGDRLTAEKQLFRIALEIAWIYLFVRNGRKPVREAAEANRRFAKLFAACFLLPRAAVAEAAASLGVGRADWTYPLVLRVKRHFGASAEAFSYRLLELGLVDEPRLSGIIASIKAHYAANRNSEPGETLPALVRNGRLADLVERARGIPEAAAAAEAAARHAGLR